MVCNIHFTYFLRDITVSVPAQHASEEKKASSNAGGKAAVHSAPTPSAAGVNRRTAVLFGNKRRPGRPPKIAQTEPTMPESSTSSDKAAKKSQPTGEPDDRQEPESFKSSAVENPSSSSAGQAKQKRSRKKRPSDDGIGSDGTFGVGARWSDRLGISAAGGDWGLAAAAGAKSTDGKEASSSKSHAPPAKESFRQYRDMNDSDVEPARESDHEDVASEASSSDDGTSSSQSDREEGESSSSSDSEDDDDLPLAKRGLFVSCLRNGPTTSRSFGPINRVVADYRF
jgi:hypothetical protein